jgi:hypothetical protein
VKVIQGNRENTAGQSVFLARPLSLSSGFLFIPGQHTPPPPPAAAAAEAFDLSLPLCWGNWQRERRFSQKNDIYARRQGKGWGVGGGGVAIKD